MAKKSVICSNCGEPLLRYKTKTETYFCGAGCKGAWQVKQRESNGFTKEWLIEEYVVKEKSANQIAREIGRDSKRVWEWMRDYGIKTRPRGTDYGQNFKKGMESPFKGKRHKEETKELFRKIAKEDGRVPYLKNGKHWLKEDGVKPASWRGGISPERNAFYSSPAWVEAVKKVWARDNATCQKCGKRHNTAKNRGRFHIHHIISFKVKPERANPDNLILLCAQCHRWVHSKKNIDKEFIRRYRNG